MVAMEQEGEEELWLPCLRYKGAPGYSLGMAIGKRFQTIIRSRLASDPALQSDMLPFAATPEGQHLVAALVATNRHSSHSQSKPNLNTLLKITECGQCRQQYPVYFDEIRGTADGAEVPFLQVSTQANLTQESFTVHKIDV